MERETGQVSGPGGAAGENAGDAGLLEFVRANEKLIRVRFREHFEDLGAGGQDSSDFFVSVFRRLDGLAALEDQARTSSKLREELRRVMRAAIQDYVKQDQTESTGKTRVLPPLGLSTDDDGSLSEDDRERAAKIMRGLGPEDARILRLRLAGHSHRSIAAAVGATTSGIRMRWSRITRQLTEWFDRGAA